MKYMNCKICDKTLKNIKSVSAHINTHGMKLIEYMSKYESFEVPKCKFCDKNAKVRRGINYQLTCGGEECRRMVNVDRKHSDETKILISTKRKKWLSENNEKHPWKNNKKFKSVPCEHLKEILKTNNIYFAEEYKPLNDRNYSIDILIPNKGIGLEVNGNQHYNPDKTLKGYYKMRKDEIEKVGISLIDIHYSNVYKQKFIIDLVNMINGHCDKLDLDFTFVSKNSGNFCECGKKISYGSKNCNECSSNKRRKVSRPNTDELESDVETIGYSATGRKYGVSDNCIRKWLKNAKKLENKKGNRFLHSPLRFT